MAYVFAPTDVSISSFNLSANTQAYDLVTTSRSVIDVSPKVLIGAHILSPTPEPESYAMFLAGLAMLGAIARRKKHAD